MASVDILPYIDDEPRTCYVAEGPVDFETWLLLGREIDTELVRGVMVEKMAAQYPHEWIFAWLFRVLGGFVEYRQLGKVLGSRSAVKISGNDGRLPDILFVGADNVHIIQNDAIYGAPDLVIEIVSEHDRPHHLVPLELDYRQIGVAEIVFIDPRKQRVRLLRRQMAEEIEVEATAVPQYLEQVLTDGTLEFLSVPGLRIETEWLFTEERPDSFTVTRQLIEAVEANR